MVNPGNIVVTGTNSTFCLEGASARLGIFLGAQFGIGGIGHGEMAAQAVGCLVMADDIEAIFGHSDVTLQPVIAIHVNAVAIGLGGVLHTDIATAMAHKQGLPRPSISGERHHNHECQ